MFVAQGNRGFAGSLTGEGESAVAPRRAPRSGFLGVRENRLAELASGSLVTRVHEAVDPATCRVWEGHNRDYASLNEIVCSDLIDSLRAQSRQEVPAIVRRLNGDQKHMFEVICGARRLWSVNWLRAHDYPDFKFVVEPRELSDEEAFRIADLENRSRKDLSDYERAIDYARAIKKYYDGSQQRMVERLKVTKSWLSRYLELSRLPPEVLVCFGSPHVIGITHAAAIAPALNNPRDRSRLLNEAASLAAEQLERKARGVTVFSPAQVVARLIDTRPARRSARTLPSKQILDSEGKPIFKVQEVVGGEVVITIPASRRSDRSALVDAVDNYLKNYGRHR